jgi:hypothetical protein
VLVLLQSLQELTLLVVQKKIHVLELQFKLSQSILGGTDSCFDTLIVCNYVDCNQAESCIGAEIDAFDVSKPVF